MAQLPGRTRLTTHSIKSLGAEGEAQRERRTEKAEEEWLAPLLFSFYLSSEAEEEWLTPLLFCLWRRDDGHHHSINPLRAEGGRTEVRRTEKAKEEWLAPLLFRFYL